MGQNHIFNSFWWLHRKTLWLSKGSNLIESEQKRPNNSQIICLICIKQMNADSTTCYTQNIHIVPTQQKSIQCIILNSIWYRNTNITSVEQNSLHVEQRLSVSPSQPSVNYIRDQIWILPLQLLYILYVSLGWKKIFHVIIDHQTRE